MCSCCKGRGCNGDYNDYCCGCASMAHFGIFDGACRYAPIADYGTFGCTANYEKNPQNDGETSCGAKDVELPEGAEYHARDDFWSVRSKPMETRCAVPNIVWLAIMIAFAVGVYSSGIPGIVAAGEMIDGIRKAGGEANCIIADSIDFVEDITRPFGNISETAGTVLSNTAGAIEKASGLGATMTSIANKMTELKDFIKQDTCNYGNKAFYTPDANGAVKAWPPAALGTAATAVGTAAAGVKTAAESAVATLDATLSAVKVMLTMVNSTLGSTTAMAKTVTDGPVMELLRDKISPINGKVATQMDNVAKYQGTGVQVVFGLIFGVGAIIVVLSIVWLCGTELYECEQKKHEKAHGESEAEGEEEEEEEEEEKADAGTCCEDYLCAAFQINMICAMHLLYFFGWCLMMFCFVVALIFNPVTIVVSDVCVGMDHFADNSARWLRGPGSPFANQTLMIDAVGSCMDIQQGNILDALGVGPVLASFTNVSFGGAAAVDLGTMNFSSIDTMITEIGNIKAFDLGAKQVLTTLNALGGVDNTLAQCYLATDVTSTCGVAGSNGDDGVGNNHDNIAVQLVAKFTEMGVTNAGGSGTTLVPSVDPKSGAAWASLPMKTCTENMLDEMVGLATDIKMLVDGSSVVIKLKAGQNLIYAEGTDVSQSGVIKGKLKYETTALNGGTTEIVIKLSRKQFTDYTFTDDADLTIGTDTIPFAKIVSVAMADGLNPDLELTKSGLAGASGAMTPIKEQIGILYSSASCAFVRRRMNGMLKGVCGNMLGGMYALAWSLTMIGIMLFGLLFVVQSCAVSRFRMYDVACWQHDHSEGKCGGDHGDDDDEDGGVELASVGKVV